MQDFFRVEPGELRQAEEIIGLRAVKKVLDMHYEARLQAQMSYKAVYEHTKLKKEIARDTFLPKEQLMMVSI